MLLRRPLLILAALAMLAACDNSADTAPRQYQPLDRPYFTNSIPPCTPVAGTDVDPCEPTRETIDNPSGSGYDPGTSPRSMRSFLDGSSDISVSHIVIRGTYLPNTIRCEAAGPSRNAPYINLRDWSSSIVCFSDVRVNDYIVGSGPSQLTVVVKSVVLAGGEETARRYERTLARGGWDWLIEVPEGGIGGNEEIMFIGPGWNFNFEVWQVFNTWDVQRKEDGSVVAVHPHAEYWLWIDQYGSSVELSLSSFASLVGAADQERINDNGGRIRPSSSAPSLVQDANNLHAFHVETGNVNHPDGPPAMPPPPCGKAVPNQANNPGLMLDCIALLAAKDTLRGTGTLNWSVDVAMADWDGVRVLGTPGRVTRLTITSGGLNGTVPPSIGELSALQILWLNRNQLSGPIPQELTGLSSLEQLLLNENRLTGPIPSALGDLSNLESLWLHKNQLSGDVPSELGGAG